MPEFKVIYPTESEQNKSSGSLVGNRIDQNKVLRLIGHGDMASVYLAKRADEAYEANVAVKVIRQGMDTPSNITRFKREKYSRPT